MTATNRADSTDSRDLSPGHPDSRSAAVEDSQQHQAEVAALLKASRAILEYQDFEDAARAIFDCCKQLIGASSGYVALLNRDGTENDVVFLDSGGLSCTVDPSLPMPIRGLRESAYRNAVAVFDNDFSHSPWLDFLPQGHVRLDNVLFAPLIIEREVAGLLGMANKPGGFSERDVRMASAFGELAAVALRNSRTLESLKSSEQQFRSLTQSASDGIVSTDGTGRITFWNRAAEKMFGHAADEIVGKPITSVTPERFHQRHLEAMRQILAAGKSDISDKTMEVIGVRADGSEFPVELSLSTWENEGDICVTAVLRDITRRKQTNVLRRQITHDLGERVKELNCLHSVSKLIADPALSLEDVFRQTVELLPPAWQFPEIACARTMIEAKEFSTPGFRRTAWFQSADVFASGTKCGKVEVCYLRPMPERAEGPFLTEERHLIEAVAGHLGRTVETRRTQDALRNARDELETKVLHRTSELSRKEESLLQAQRMAHLGNWDWDVETNRLQWSDEVYRIFGFQPRAFVATYEIFSKSVHPDDRRHVEQAVKRALLDPEARYGIDHRIVRPDGSERIVHENGEVVFDAGGKPVRMIGTVHDITERRRLERELLTIGSEEQRRIAQELHDGLGQQLTGLGYLAKSLQRRLQSRDLPEAKSAAGLVEGIQESHADLHRVVEGLLPPDIDAEHLVAALQLLVDNVQEQTGISCRCVTDSPVQISNNKTAIQVYRIAQEAVNNAVKHARAKHIVVHVKSALDRITFEVRDDGIGPDRETGKHSGSGLRIMRYRARAIGGTLRIERRPEGGTCVGYTIPREYGDDDR